MLWIYKGSRAVVSLDDGTALRGTLAWSWAFGWLKLVEVEELLEGGVREAAGVALIPKASITMVQVV